VVVRSVCRKEDVFTEASKALKQVSNKNEQQTVNAETGLDNSSNSNKIKTADARMPAFVDMISYIQKKVHYFSFFLFKTDCR
jgi:hypothetical protein